MKTYIIKRLLLMAVTLFGISLITFVIVQAAPGDPAAARAQAGGGAGGKQQISKKVIEDTRKLYYLDKPIILNTDPDDKWKVQRRLLDTIVSPKSEEEERRDAQGEYLEIGTAGLQPLARELAAPHSEEPRERLIELAGQIVPGIKAAPGGDRAAVAAELAGKLDGAALACADEKARAVAEKILEGARAGPGGAPADESGFAIPGAALAPFLIDAARGKASDAERDAAQRVLSQVLRKPWSVPDDAANRTRLEGLYEEAKAAQARAGGAELPPRDRWIADRRETEAREYCGRWASYWRDNQDRFLTYSGAQATWRMFTQTRFGRWFGMLLRGDFGESYRTKQPVTTLIAERLPVSLQLSLISVAIAYAIAVPLGIHSAIRRGSRLDSFLTVGLFVLYSLPSFFVAEMLIIFTTGGDYPLLFPTGQLESGSPADMPFGSVFLDRVWHLVLPITVLTYASFAYISRQMRSAMLETIRQDYIRTAKAKGLSERTVTFKHALRNSMIPILTLLSSLLPSLLSGSVIVEQIFTINGMGKLGFESVINRDYPVIMGISFFSALLTLLGIFLSDLSYALVDPRISYE